MTAEYILGLFSTEYSRIKKSGATRLSVNFTLTDKSVITINADKDLNFAIKPAVVDGVLQLWDVPQITSTTQSATEVKTTSNYHRYNVPIEDVARVEFDFDVVQTTEIEIHPVENE